MTLGLALYAMLGPFRDFGLTPALISKKGLTEEFISSAYSLRLVIAGILAAACILGAAALPFVFGIPELRPIMLLIGVAVFVEPLGFVSNAMLQKDLEFKKLAAADVTSILAMAAATIASGFLNLALYALFIGTVVYACVRTAVIIRFKKVPVKLVRKPQKEKFLLEFGGPLVTAGVIVYVVLNLNIFVLGRMDLAALGLYGLAFLWASTPADIAAAAIGRVMLPTYSILKNDGHAIYDAYLRTLRHLLIIALAAFIFLFILSPVIIDIIYGTTWSGAIPILLILLVFGLSRTIAELTASLILSFGKTSSLLWANILNLSIMAILVLPATELFGATGCAALLAGTYLIYILVLWGMISKQMGERPTRIATTALVPLAASIIALGIGASTHLVSSGGLHIMLFLLTAVGLYLLLLFRFARRDLLLSITYLRYAMGLRSRIRTHR